MRTFTERLAGNRLRRLLREERAAEAIEADQRNVDADYAEAGLETENTDYVDAELEHIDDANAADYEDAFHLRPRESHVDGLKALTVPAVSTAYPTVENGGAFASGSGSSKASANSGSNHNLLANLAQKPCRSRLGKGRRHPCRQQEATENSDLPVYESPFAKATAADHHIGVDRVPRTALTNVVSETLEVAGISPGTASDE